MQYRPFGKLGFEISTFGMGCMRLPTKGEAEPGKRPPVDVDEAVRMIRRAYESGVNYFDTAYVYHDGLSEPALGKGVKPFRSEVKLASKLALWADTKENWEKMLDTTLRRLDTDYLDFYLLHSLNRERFEPMKDDLLAFLDRMVEKGKILYPAFSIHDNFDCFKMILDSYDKWGMAQIQYNLLDEVTNSQPGLEGVEYAGKKGVPLVIMEPLRGGALAGRLPKEVKDLYDAFPVKRSQVEWAFRAIYNRPEVAVILSGVSTMEQLEDNIAIFDKAAPNAMPKEEIELLSKVRNAYLSRVKAGCTGCRYCMPCPNGVHIPDILQSYDRAYMFDNMDAFKADYKRLAAGGHGADKCIQCGACESACPQHLPIMELLPAFAKDAE